MLGEWLFFSQDWAGIDFTACNSTAITMLKPKRLNPTCVQTSMLCIAS